MEGTRPGHRILKTAGSLPMLCPFKTRPFRFEWAGGVLHGPLITNKGLKGRANERWAVSQGLDLNCPGRHRGALGSALHNASFKGRSRGDGPAFLPKMPHPAPA